MNQLSSKGLSLLKTLEGFRNAPYDDQTGKDTDSWVAGATVGFGHLIDRDEWDEFKDGVTREEAERLLRQDLRPFVNAVRNKTQTPLSQHQFDALVIFTFNIGRTAFRNSSVLKLINRPQTNTQYRNLESAWKAWNRSQGQVMEGLKRRRAIEWQLFESGRYRK